MNRLDILLSAGMVSLTPAPSLPPFEPKPVDLEMPAELFPETTKLESAHKLTDTFVAEISFELIPAGTFMMGSPAGTGSDDERPQHKVTIRKSFYMGVTPITQGQYAELMGKNPSFFSSTGEGSSQVANLDTSNFPVERVAWFEAAQFCNALSEAEGLEPYYGISGEVVEIINGDGKGYRLPTEAEWEYCARAGHSGEYGFDGDVTMLGRFAWFGQNNGGRTHHVARLEPNDFGLYDMLGNVWEWTWDGYEADYYVRSPEVDPPGPTEALYRVNRGGSGDYSLGGTRVTNRNRRAPANRAVNIGFRVVRTQ
jgi:formylglycine-generating enzyme required for sulfatase activity